MIPLGSVEVDNHYLGAKTEPRKDRCERRALIAFGHWGFCVFRLDVLCYLMANTVRNFVISPVGATGCTAWLSHVVNSAYCL